MIINISLDTSSRFFRQTFIATTLLAAFICFGLAAFSWTGPTGTPPANNVDAPINVGSLTQIKDGVLEVNGFSNVGLTQLKGTTINSGTVTGLSITTANQSPWALTIKNDSSSQRGIEIFQYNNGNSMIYNGYGSANQGYLQFGTGGYVTAYPGICLNGVCRTTWPAAGTAYAPSVTTATCSANGYYSGMDWVNGACTASCPSGYVVVGGGCNAAGASYPSGNGWYCNPLAGGQRVSTTYAYARCLK